MQNERKHAVKQQFQLCVDSLSILLFKKKKIDYFLLLQFLMFHFNKILFKIIIFTTRLIAFNIAYYLLWTSNARELISRTSDCSAI